MRCRYVYSKFLIYLRGTVCWLQQGVRIYCNAKSRGVVTATPVLQLCAGRYVYCMYAKGDSVEHMNCIEHVHSVLAA